jgi:formiminotetrahydrofolate cyclodeaminase
VTGHAETAVALSWLAERLALASPVEGAGVVAAGVVELSSGLCESIARASLHCWADARGMAIQAATVRARAREAGIANGRAYGAARDALARPGATGREGELLAALTAAADTLLAIAAAGADGASLAAEVAGHCEAGLRADAAAAAELAVAATRSAAALVDVNLALLAGDHRRERAYSIVAAADRAGVAARAAVDPG